MTPDKHLLTIRALNEQVKEIDRQFRPLGEKLRASVTAARKEGASWESIGKALGCSKQAAQQRFGYTIVNEG